MRNLVYVLLGILSISAVSCEQFENVKDIKKIEPLQATIRVQLDLDSEIPTPDQLQVKLVNFLERHEVTKAMPNTGSVVIDDLLPGIYTVSVSAEKSKDGFTYTYSGNAVNLDIVDNGKIIDIKVGASKLGALVFKEVYFSGSRTPTGGSYFRDQFYEIYNNSDVVQNVRGLSIASLNPGNATANLPVWPGPDAKKYVYAQQIWQVPNDKDYPLNPGESIVIAQMADNHRKPNLNPNAPLSLLSAEFETLINTTALIQDNPAINMKMAFWPSPTPQWLTPVFGGAFVLFFPSQPINPNSTTEVVSALGSSSKDYRIPIVDIVDALENVGNANQVQMKRMPAVLDAGAATVGATYVSSSVARKVKETKSDGRAVLQDTNNSSDDFEVNPAPQIRRHGAKAPSWNTWNN